MKRHITTVAAFLLFSSPAHSQNPTGQDHIRIEQKVTEEKDGDKVIEKHYYYKEIIKELPKEEEEYIKHLYQELKSPLKKPKKIAAVRRVEDDLVEINKGSIHKVREGDVYKILDRNGRQKAKVEIEAIADSVSIGRSYFVGNSIEVLDKAKFIGQRRFWGSGGIGGISIYDSDKTSRSEKYRGYGMYWRFLFQKSWGVGFSAARFTKEEDTGDNPRILQNIPDGWKKHLKTGDVSLTRAADYGGRYDFIAPIDIRRYFFHPAWYSCFLGVGAAYFTSEYKFGFYEYRDHSFQRQVIIVDHTTKTGIAPTLTAGTEIAFGKYFRLSIMGYYLHGPSIEISGYKPLTKPLIASIAVIGTW